MISNTEGNSQCHLIPELSNEHTDRPYKELHCREDLCPCGLAAFMQVPPESALLEGQFI